MVRTLARSGSVSNAAYELGVSQPAISQQLGKLEQELGHKLFNRAARRFTLTPEGEAFLIFAHGIRHIDVEARRHFSQLQTHSTLHLGLVEEFIRIRLAHILALFVKEFANAQVVISANLTERLVSDFDGGQYDFVIANAIRSTRGSLLRQFEVVWIGRENVLASAVPLPLILAPQPAPFREVALETLRAQGRPWRIVFESASLSAREAAVLAGIGVSITSRLIVPKGAIILDEASGLPTLPSLDLFMLERQPRNTDDEVVPAMREVIRSVFETLGKLGPSMDQ